jgi:hypothetical protein
MLISFPAFHSRHLHTVALTGISEPLPVAQTFAFEDIKTGLSLQSIARLDTLVTMVRLPPGWKTSVSLLWRHIVCVI